MGGPSCLTGSWLWCWQWGGPVVWLPSRGRGSTLQVMCHQPEKAQADSADPGVPGRQSGSPVSAWKPHRPPPPISRTGPIHGMIRGEGEVVGDLWSTTTAANATSHRSSAGGGSTWTRADWLRATTGTGPSPTITRRHGKSRWEFGTGSDHRGEAALSMQPKLM